MTVPDRANAQADRGTEVQGAGNVRNRMTRVEVLSRRGCVVEPEGFANTMVARAGNYTSVMASSVECINGALYGQ